MNKNQMITNLLSGNRLKLMKARPGFTFELIDNNLYRCDTTGEVLTKEEINERYPNPGGMHINGAHLIDINKKISKILIFEIPKDRIIT